MKVFSGVVAILLGLGAIFGALGLQTVWAPPEEITATVPSGGSQSPADAPLTVITEGINDVDEDDVEYTLNGDGEYTLMLGQIRDIEAWVDDAAHNTITGINTDVEDGENPVMTVEHTEGTDEVPSPVNSDLWVDTQQAEGAVTQRWSTPAEGQWALLVVADGTAPAPMDLSVTWVNHEGDSPWIVPLYIIGAVLVLIGLTLLAWTFVVFQRKRKRPSGRRVAGREHTETVAAGAVPTATASEDDDTGNDPDDDSDDSENIPDQKQSVGEDDQQTTSSGARDDGGDPPESPFLKRVMKTLTAAGLSAGLISSGIGPAQADTVESPSPESSESAGDESGEEASQAPSAGADAEEAEAGKYPVVVDQQLEMILSQVADSVASADEEQDPDALEDRTAGQAQQVRVDNYRNMGVDEEATKLVQPLSAGPVLSAWSDQDEAFPRDLAVVTEGEENSSPQMMLLRQESPRDQYKVSYVSQLTPGAELPLSSVMDSGIANLAVDDDSELSASPEQAIGWVGDYLSDPEADASSRVADNPVIGAIHAHQDGVVEESADTTVELNRTPVENGYTAMRLPDGSGLVIGSFDAVTRLTPDEEGAAVQVSDLAAEIAGEDSTTYEGVVEQTYRESVVVRIPAGDDEPVSLVGMSDELSSVEYLD